MPKTERKIEGELTKGQKKARADKYEAGFQQLILQNPLTRVVRTSSPDPYISRLISEIGARMMRIDSDTDRLSLEMDLGACHMNGCPLDLHKLLHAEHGSFGHDVRGIVRFIDRTTGKLPEGKFLPRCALPENGL